MSIFWCYAFLAVIASIQFGLVSGDDPLKRSRRAISSYSFSRDHIPGTSFKTGTFYVIRMKRFPTGVVSVSSNQHEYGYNYVFIDNNEAHRDKYARGGDWYKYTQWAFLSSRTPGWYHLINRAKSCQYATWSDSEVIDAERTYYMTLDPNYPGNHVPDDFLFKPVQHFSEPINSPNYQLKIKSMQNAIVSWNDGNSSNSAYYIHIENTTDQTWLRRYSWGNIWYEDTLFNFEEVNDQDEDRVEDNTGNNWVGQAYYDSLVGKPDYDYENGGATARVNLFIATIPIFVFFKYHHQL